jgi:histidinol dehydrogenase
MNIAVIKGFTSARDQLDRSAPLEGRLSSQTQSSSSNVERTVKRIITAVRRGGDAALIRYTRRLDGVSLKHLEVSNSEIKIAYEQVEPQLISALKLAAQRIRDFHSARMKEHTLAVMHNGTGRKIIPLEKAGIYVPGGTAAYPSTVLMTAIPARAAGVPELVMVTPPRSDGTIPPSTLAAAHIAGVDRIFKIGGAQAIAALAYGTESVPRVDKICGPGNVYVAAAKRLVFGAVDIDGIEGPSEVIVIADESARAEYCAADLIAQAEHDRLTSAIFITTSSELADKVKEELSAQLMHADIKGREAIARQALESGGKIVIVDSVKEAIELSNMFAPEHLLIMVRNAESYLDCVRNAGCVFVGESSPVVLGDYIAGPSHVLPTDGTARFGSALGVEDFLKSVNIVILDRKDLVELGPAAAVIARSEGLAGHAHAVDIRLKKDG